MPGWHRAYQRIKLTVAPLLRRRVLSFEIHNPFVGFFAHLNWCAFVLEYCHRRNLTAQLSATSPHYRDPARSPNWLSYFFNVIDATPHVDFRISQFSELSMPDRYLARQTIESTSALVSRHLSLRPEIQSRLDSLYAEHFQGRKVLGVHFRGTDKKEEAPRVTWDAMRQTVSNYLDDNPHIDALFVASDEPAFTGYMRQSFPALALLPAHSELAARYKADLGAANYRKGEETLLDCLMLSRCSALIRTTSFLSAWASIFNPKLPIVLLNRPYAESLWFPESALIPRSMDRYLRGPLS
jgi:Nodulation protein Z (NodZ)